MENNKVWYAYEDGSGIVNAGVFNSEAQTSSFDNFSRQIFHLYVEILELLLKHNLEGFIPDWIQRFIRDCGFVHCFRSQFELHIWITRAWKTSRKC